MIPDLMLPKKVDHHSRLPRAQNPHPLVRLVTATPKRAMLRELTDAELHHLIALAEQECYRRLGIKLSEDN